MKPTTTREKMLVLVLPAVLILGLYGLKLSGLRSRSKGAETALAAAQKTQPIPAQVQAERRRIADLNQQLGDVEKQLRDQEAAWRELQATRSSNSTARIESIEGLATLLNSNHLELRDSESAETGNAAKLPKELERVATLLAENRPDMKPQLWRVRFAGRYSDVLHALEELKTADPSAIPIHLQMDEATLSTEDRNWTLYLWI